MVPRRRLELPRLSALVPETSASTNSATWARHAGSEGGELRAGPRRCQPRAAARTCTGTRWAIGSIHEHQAGHGFRRLRLYRPGHRAGARASRAIWCASPCRRIELAEPVKTAGDVGQITLMRANLAHAGVGGRRHRRQPGRDQRRRHSLPARPPALSSGPCRGRPGDRRGGPRRGRRSGWSISRASAPTAAARRTATSSPRSRREDAIVAAFESATILRPSVVFGPDDAMFNRLAKIAALAPFMPVVGNGRAKVQPVFVRRRRRGRRGRAGAARDGQERVRAGRPARLHLSRDRRPHPARDRPRQADHRRAGRPDEDRGLLRRVPARAAAHPRPGRSPDARQRRARPGAKTLADLGIAPTAAEVILPTYLDRFRVGGRYNQHAPA